MKMDLNSTSDAVKRSSSHRSFCASSSWLNCEGLCVGRACWFALRDKIEDGRVHAPIQTHTHTYLVDGGVGAAGEQGRVVLLHEDAQLSKL